jgi:hypothetical protein
MIGSRAHRPTIERQTSGRQQVVLFFDAMGMRMPADAINHRLSCGATPSPARFAHTTPMDGTIGALMDRTP